MANIKDLKKRIRSTKSTLKITSAMKLVSAAKLAKAQAQIVGFKPYSYELDQTVRTVAALSEHYEHEFFNEKRSNKAVLLVISSDKGLCGSYNSSIVKKVKGFVAENANLDFKVFFIGKKAKELLSSEVNTGGHFTFQKADPTYDEVKKISLELAEQFRIGEIGKIFVAYNTFYSAISSESIVKQALPLKHDKNENAKLKEQYPYDFKYDIEPESILNTLVPETYNSIIWTAILDALASEHGSRMSAMDSATKNSKEMIRKLTLKMNKLRQAAITTELIEVVSGAESLNS